jgi:hypothetical protein
LLLSAMHAVGYAAVAASPLLAWPRYGAGRKGRGDAV